MFDEISTFEILVFGLWMESALKRDPNAKTNKAKCQFESKLKRQNLYLGNSPLNGTTRLFGCVLFQKYP
jgi:hypothetical protein